MPEAGRFISVCGIAVWGAEAEASTVPVAAARRTLFQTRICTKLFRINTYKMLEKHAYNYL